MKWILPLAALLLVVGPAPLRAQGPAVGQLLDAAGRAQELGDADRLVAAALANNRGFQSVSGRVDTQRVAVLEAETAEIPRRLGQNSTNSSRPAVVGLTV